jgi:hypothetical protein
MRLLQAALELQQLVGNTAGIDLVGAGTHRPLDRRHLRGIDGRGRGNRFFDLLQRPAAVEAEASLPELSATAVPPFEPLTGARG